MEQVALEVLVVVVQELMDPVVLERLIRVTLAVKALQAVPAVKLLVVVVLEQLQLTPLAILQPEEMEYKLL
jgi:hypothetical protein